MTDSRAADLCCTWFSARDRLHIERENDRVRTWLTPVAGWNISPTTAMPSSSPLSWRPRPPPRSRRTIALYAAHTFLLGAGALRGRLMNSGSPPLSRGAGARASSVRRARSRASGSWEGNATTLDGNTLRTDSVVMREAQSLPSRGSVATRGLRTPVGGWFYNSGINQGYRCRCSAAFSIRNGVAEAGAKEGGFRGEDQVAIPLGDRSSVRLGE